ncbi:glycosyltransferase [Plesiomonas shigelloides]|uniref:glycosyltransferase n=1 Tax=Plesiomonas shigelloides TaxID=703 RepID=UPI001C5B7178|nr:glycosyltransferase [Plesiomonas shigelloides]MBW3792557.1 glycosyltransferase [Plesiomonas shigelloides]
MKITPIELSIIVPAYNVEKYLAACIDSLVVDILSHNLERIEVIIINDGSTDSTLDIAKEYALQFKYIKIISKPNGGLSDARNVGVTNSIGKYLSFIDSDDIIKPGFINDILKVIDGNNDIDLITFDVHKFFGTPTFSKRTFNFSTVSKYFYCSKPLIACNKIYKKTLFNGIIFPLGRYYEDVWTTPFLIVKATTYIHIDNDYYGYRQRHGSITANVDSKYMDIIGALGQFSSMRNDLFIDNLFVGQFFTLILLSLRLPITYSYRNLTMVLSFYCSQTDITPYKNKFHERILFYVFKWLKSKSIFAILFGWPAVHIHLLVKNYRGK